MSRFLPTRIPVRLPDRQAGQKWLAALVIALSATVLAIGWRNTAVISQPLGDFEEFLYDAVYKSRTPADRRGGDVVIIAIDQSSLEKLDQKAIDDVRVAWPWPRELYGDMVQYLEKCGARVVAFDMLFSEIDRNHQQLADQTFADLVAETKVPVVFGTLVDADGRPGSFAPPIKDPTLGAVNAEEVTLRHYYPFIRGFPSLAYRAAGMFTGQEPAQRERFLVHYYGKHRYPDGRQTFPYIAAFNVLAATRGVESAAPAELFRDKIVLIGGTAPTLYDAKATPLDRLYPGVEYQATAIENILFRQRVHVVPGFLAGVITLAGALSAAAGSLLPTRTWVKVMWAVLTVAAVVGLAVVLFRGPTIRHLPLAAPVVALLLSTVAAFAWSYFTEGRQRLFFSNAFALATSPEVAKAIDRDRTSINLGGQRREATMMFTDLAGFTDFAETMDVEKLTLLLQTYMEAMSEEILRQGGYLDKYIGDAIMSSWNGVIDQPDHAARACRAALHIKRREVELEEELRRLAGARIVTRIGVNTGRVAFGNLGSSRKLQVTVLGDSVNLAARLEPANKLYGSEVLISQTTAEQVKGLFVMRELDLLRVKGKTKPMAVYELMAEGEPTPELRKRVELYAAGLAQYRKQRWDDAEGALLTLLKDHPNDGPAAALLARVGKLRHDPPVPEWDGVYVAKEK